MQFHADLAPEAAVAEGTTKLPPGNAPRAGTVKLIPATNAIPPGRRLNEPAAMIIQGAHSGDEGKKAKRERPTSFDVAHSRNQTVWGKLCAANCVELGGFEPPTFSLRTRRATNCAIAPYIRKVSIPPTPAGSAN